MMNEYSILGSPVDDLESLFRLLSPTEMSYSRTMNWKRGAVALVLVAVVSAFPYGPLFAWSPVHPGYLRLRSSRADILYPVGSPSEAAYREMDRYVAIAEAFHGLRCPKRITVVVCRNWSDCIRFAPFLSRQRPAGVTIPTGTVIYLTPSVAGVLDVGGTLRHELSHATLNQNRSLISVWRLLKQPWFNEGAAGVIAGLEAPAPGRKLVALPATEFVRRARNEDLWACFDAVLQKDWRFSYTAWTFFWDREIELRGKKMFLNFERACIADPDKCRSSFESSYGTSLEAAVTTYQNDILSGRFVPIDQAVQIR